MTAKEKIDKALIDSNESIKSNKKAFAELPKHIGENEQISFIMEGSLSIMKEICLSFHLFCGNCNWQNNKIMLVQLYIYNHVCQFQ